MENEKSALEHHHIKIGLAKLKECGMLAKLSEEKEEKLKEVCVCVCVLCLCLELS